MTSSSEDLAPREDRTPRYWMHKRDAGTIVMANAPGNYFENNPNFREAWVSHVPPASPEVTYEWGIRDEANDEIRACHDEKSARSIVGYDSERYALLRRVVHSAWEEVDG